MGPSIFDLSLLHDQSDLFALGGVAIGRGMRLGLPLDLWHLVLVDFPDAYDQFLVDVEDGREALLHRQAERVLVPEIVRVQDPLLLFPLFQVLRLALSLLEERGSDLLWNLTVVAVDLQFGDSEDFKLLFTMGYLNAEG